MIISAQNNLSGHINKAKTSEFRFIPTLSLLHALAVKENWCTLPMQQDKALNKELKQSKPCEEAFKPRAGKYVIQAVPRSPFQAA